MPPLPPADSDEEENEPDVPLLNPAYSDKEDNEPDIPPLHSKENGEEDNDPELTTLPSADSSKEVKTSDDRSVTYCGSILALISQVRKLFEGLGWFSGEAVKYLLDGETTKCILSYLMMTKNKFVRLMMSY